VGRGRGLRRTPSPESESESHSVAGPGAQGGVNLKVIPKMFNISNHSATSESPRDSAGLRVSESRGPGADSESEVAESPAAAAVLAAAAGHCDHDRGSLRLARGIHGPASP
jgi:hypothetical protein